MVLADGLAHFAAACTICSMIAKSAIALIVVVCSMPIMITGPGCQASPRSATNAFGDLSIVAGRITFFENIALPPEATVHVRLIERPDIGQERTIAERVFAGFRSRSTEFELQYDPAAVNSGSMMFVDATVFVADRVWFRSSGNDRVRGEHMNILVRSAR